MNDYGVLWDMDGVLVDTEQFHFQAFMEVLPRFGLRVDPESFRRTFGMNNAGIVELLAGRKLDPGFTRQIIDAKEVYFRDLARGQVQPLPGVGKWLERLHSAGVPMAVASSAPMENIELLISEMGLQAYFHAMVSADQLPGKPDPAVFLQAAGCIGQPPPRCIVVEDSLVGVEAARRAGMKCIAVTNTNPAEKLQDANLIVDSLDKLPPDAFDCLSK